MAFIFKGKGQGEAKEKKVWKSIRDLRCKKSFTDVNNTLFWT